MSSPLSRIREAEHDAREAAETPAVALQQTAIIRRLRGKPSPLSRTMTLSHDPTVIAARAAAIDAAAAREIEASYIQPSAVPGTTETK